MDTSQTNHFDILVLGSGEAGKYIAWTLSSKAGKRCAVIERRWLGGSCPNVACLPSKNVVHSANVAHLASQGSIYGLPFMMGDTAGGRGCMKMEAVRARKRDMVKGLVEMHAGKYQDSGVELIWGEGKFLQAKKIEVTGADGDKRLVFRVTVLHPTLFSRTQRVALFDSLRDQGTIRLNSSNELDHWLAVLELL